MLTPTRRLFSKASLLTVPMSFEVSSDFSKPKPLPPRNRWHFYKEDVLIEDMLLSYYKHKRRFFFSSYSEQRHRCVVVSHDGHLIFYSTEDAGFVLDIRQAVGLCSQTVASPSPATRRILTVKFSFGSLFLVLVGEKVHKWMSILQAINAGVHQPLPPLLDEAAVFSNLPARSEDSCFVNRSPTTQSIANSCGDETPQFVRTAAPGFNSSPWTTPPGRHHAGSDCENDDDEGEASCSSTYSEVRSIRFGPLDVATLRKTVELRLNSPFEVRKKLTLPNGKVIKLKTRYD